MLHNSKPIASERCAQNGGMEENPYKAPGELDASSRRDPNEREAIQKLTLGVLVAIIGSAFLGAWALVGILAYAYNATGR